MFNSIAPLQSWGLVVKPGITSPLHGEGFGFKSRPVHFKYHKIILNNFLMCQKLKQFLSAQKQIIFDETRYCIITGGWREYD